MELIAEEGVPLLGSTVIIACFSSTSGGWNCSYILLREVCLALVNILNRQFSLLPLILCIYLWMLLFNLSLGLLNFSNFTKSRKTMTKKVLS